MNNYEDSEMEFGDSHLECDSFNGLLASEPVLAREWDTPEEDAAWANL
jgi:hypothetical protein